jgi:hypothetical protein
MGMCGNEIQRLKITEGKITDQVTEFKYLGNRVSDYKKYVKYTLQRHNRINGIIKRNFGKQMSNETKQKNTQHNSNSRSQIWKRDMGAE